MKYSYSFDQDEYTGQFDSFDEAYVAAKRELEFVEDPQTEVWIAEIIDAEAYLRDQAQYIAEWFIDILETQLCDIMPAEEDMIMPNPDGPDGLIKFGNAIIDATVANCEFLHFGVENAVRVDVGPVEN